MGVIIKRPHIIVDELEGHVSKIEIKHYDDNENLIGISQDDDSIVINISNIDELIAGLQAFQQGLKV